MGCNAWGQAVLSAAALLLPALLEVRLLKKEEQELTDFISIRRFFRTRAGTSNINI